MSFMSRAPTKADLDMHELLSLMQFMRESTEIQIVQKICFNELFANPIIISGQSTQRSIVAASNAHETAVIIDNAFAEAQRSDMWLRWAKPLFQMIEAIGFAPVVAVPNDGAHRCIRDTDQLRPAILNLHTVERIEHVVLSDGTHQFKYKRLAGTDIEGNEDTALAVDSDGFYRYVLTVGVEFPSEDHRINSRVKRIREAYSIYLHKMETTKRSDRERANPTLIVVDPLAASGANQNDPDRLTSGVYPDIDEAGHCGEKPGTGTASAATAAQMRDMYATLGDTPGADVHSGAGSAAERFGLKRTRDGVAKLRLPDDEVFAANRPSTAEIRELFVAKQAYVETVSMTWGVPLQMWSQGDATGKAKLNTHAARPETARLFVDAQAERKTWLEATIAEVHYFMYASEMTRIEIGRIATLRQKEDADAEELHRKLRQAGKTAGVSSRRKTPEFDAVAWDRQIRVTVSMAATVDLETAMSLYEKGMLTWEATAHHFQKRLRIPVDSFPRAPPKTDSDLEYAKMKVAAMQKQQQANAPSSSSSGSRSKTKSKSKSS